MYNDSLLNRHTGSNPNDKLSWEYAEAITGLGEVRELYGLYKDAENLYQKSLAIANMLSEKRGVISSQSCMAHLYSMTNRRLAADSLYENLFAQLLKKNTYDYFSYFTAYTYYCENLVMLNQLPKAFEKVKYISELLFTDLQNNFPGMTEDDQINYLVSLNNYKNLLATIAAGQQAGANEIVNYALNRLLQLKGIILTYQQRRLQSIRHSQDEALTKLAENWISIKIKLYKSYTSGANATITNHLETLASRYDQEIAAKTGISLQAINSLLTDTISNRLLPGEAAIEFFRYRQGEGTESNYGAFVLRHTAPPLFVKLCMESRLKECFKTTFFNKFNTEHQLKNGQLIYDLVWKPLWQQMNKIDKVYYSPAGLLNYISFDALPGATPNSSLLQEVNLVRLSSIRNLPDAVYSQNETPSTAVLWGNIDCSERAYSSTAFSYKAPDADNLPASLASSVKGSPGAKGFDPLKNDELPVVRAIMQRKRIPVSVYESLNATEENFKQNAAAFSGWLHISSHGFYAGNPTDTGAQPQYTNRFTTPLNPLLRCGLILNGANWSWSGKTLLTNREDGILTGYEIAMMDLSKVKLVVLSACETGLGDIDAGSEGVLGLQRAFRLAGVNKMVISLWNVNAKATEELMATFYQEMTAGRSPAVALRNAKLQMAKAQIRATGKNLPYDWAGFVLVE